MSKMAYYADFVIMPVMMLALLIVYPVSVPAVVFGFLAWTLAEYVIHRFAFHRVPLFRTAHDEHHEKPHGRTGVTSWHSAAIFLGLALVMPAGILVGFVLGYFAYIVLHHATHHWTIRPTSPLYGLKMRHVLHHRGVEANFGITTTLWDRILGTYQGSRTH